MSISLNTSLAAARLDGLAAMNYNIAIHQDVLFDSARASFSGILLVFDSQDDYTEAYNAYRAGADDLEDAEAEAAANTIGQCSGATTISLASTISTKVNANAALDAQYGSLITSTPTCYDMGGGYYAAVYDSGAMVITDAAGNGVIIGTDGTADSLDGTYTWQFENTSSFILPSDAKITITPDASSINGFSAELIRGDAYVSVDGSGGQLDCDYNSSGAQSLDDASNDGWIFSMGGNANIWSLSGNTLGDTGSGREVVATSGKLFHYTLEDITDISISSTFSDYLSANGFTLVDRDGDGLYNQYEIATALEALDNAISSAAAALDATLNGASDAVDALTSLLLFLEDVRDEQEGTQGFLNDEAQARQQLANIEDRLNSALVGLKNAVKQSNGAALGAHQKAETTEAPQTLQTSQAESTSSSSTLNPGLVRAIRVLTGVSRHDPAELQQQATQPAQTDAEIATDALAQALASVLQSNADPIVAEQLAALQSGESLTEEETTALVAALDTAAGEAADPIVAGAARSLSALLTTPGSTEVNAEATVALAAVLSSAVLALPTVSNGEGDVDAIKALATALADRLQVSIGESTSGIGTTTAVAQLLAGTITENAETLPAFSEELTAAASALASGDVSTEAVQNFLGALQNELGALESIGGDVTAFAQTLAGAIAANGEALVEVSAEASTLVETAVALVEGEITLEEAESFLSALSEELSTLETAETVDSETATADTTAVSESNVTDDSTDTADSTDAADSTDSVDLTTEPAALAEAIASVITTNAEVLVESSASATSVVEAAAALVEAISEGTDVETALADFIQALGDALSTDSSETAALVQAVANAIVSNAQGILATAPESTSVVEAAAALTLEVSSEGEASPQAIQDFVAALTDQLTTAASSEAATLDTATVALANALISALTSESSEIAATAPAITQLATALSQAISLTSRTFPSTPTESITDLSQNGEATQIAAAINAVAGLTPENSAVEQPLAAAVATAVANTVVANSEILPAEVVEQAENLLSLAAEGSSEELVSALVELVSALAESDAQPVLGVALAEATDQLTPSELVAAEAVVSQALSVTSASPEQLAQTFVSQNQIAPHAPETQENLVELAAAIASATTAQTQVAAAPVIAQAAEIVATPEAFSSEEIGSVLRDALAVATTAGDQLLADQISDVLSQIESGASTAEAAIPVLETFVTNASAPAALESLASNFEALSESTETPILAQLADALSSLASGSSNPAISQAAQSLSASLAPTRENVALAQQLSSATLSSESTSPAAAAIAEAISILSTTPQAAETNAQAIVDLGQALATLTLATPPSVESVPSALSEAPEALATLILATAAENDTATAAELGVELARTITADPSAPEPIRDLAAAIVALYEEGTTDTATIADLSTALAGAVAGPTPETPGELADQLIALSSLTALEAFSEIAGAQKNATQLILDFAGKLATEVVENAESQYDAELVTLANHTLDALSSAETGADLDEVVQLVAQLANAVQGQAPAATSASSASTGVTFSSTAEAKADRVASELVTRVRTRINELHTQHTDQFRTASDLYSLAERTVEKFAQILEKDDRLQRIVVGDELSDEDQASFASKMDDLRKKWGVEWGSTPSSSESALSTKALISGLLL